MQARVGKINEKEILSYLGIRSAAPEDIRALVLDAWRACLRLAEPRLTYRIFDADSAELSGILCGSDIGRHLSCADTVLVFGATLGSAVDREISRLQITDMGRAVVFDACASGMIESVCDNFCSDVREKYGSTTGRFSPGYGDLPLAAQRVIFNSLKLSGIGMVLTEGDIMIPQKSVTAILGLKDQRKNCLQNASEER